MAGTSENVRIWTGADVYVADAGTALPTDIDTALAADYEAVGYISQDDAIGMDFSSDDTDHYAYGSVYIRKTSIKAKTTLNFTALEDTDIVYGLAFPGSDSETTTGVTTRTTRPKNLGLAIRAMVVELTDGTITKRLCIPRAQVTIAGSASLSDNEMAGVPMVVDMLGATDESDETYFSIEITDDPGADVNAS